MRPFSKRENTPLGQALISNRNLTMGLGARFQVLVVGHASVCQDEYVVHA